MTKLWSHRAAQGGGAADPIPRDEQEALSRRYGNGALIVLPLSSGRLAIFGNDRQLVDILEYGELTQAGLEAISAEAATRLSPQRPLAAVQASELSAEDMGI